MAAVGCTVEEIASTLNVDKKTFLKFMDDHPQARQARKNMVGRCDFEYVKSRIEHGLREFESRFTVVPLPNISHIFYGRDVGYSLERINLDELTTSISATEIRKKRLAGR